MPVTSTKPEVTDGSPNRSPWLIALESTSGKIAAITALVGTIAALLEKFAGLLKGSSFWGMTAAVVAALIATIFFIRDVRRIKSRVIRRPISIFIGADSFNESDRDRFFGREDEIQKVTRKLIQPHLRFFILSGRSGCGKTSLIQAGLIPELKEKHGFHVVYARVYNKPEKYLREAFREAASSYSTEGDAGEVETLITDQAPTTDKTLSNELRALQKASNRHVLVFIDQFEEFFTNHIVEDELKRFLDFVRDCVAGESNQSIKLVFSVRSDFLDDMSLFDNYVDEPFKKANRAHVEMFDLKRAREVIKLSIEYAQRQGSGLAWSDALIDRILKDLEIKYRDGISANSGSIVLPAELQIVCQMVQAQRLSEAKEYPGKEQLQRKYVEDAIETSPKPGLTKRVLLELINDNGITRAKPQSPGDIAKRLTSIDKALVRSILEHLDTPCRLANTLRRAGSKGTDVETVYELSHEYLVNIINKLSGKVISEARRANIILAEYRSRLASNPRSRISMIDSWRLRRHATETIEPEIRRGLRRSEQIFVLRIAGLVLMPTLAILGIRYGTVHFALQAQPRAPKPKIVIKQGLPFFQPLLGSDKILIDTGLLPEDLSEEGSKNCEDKKWVLNLWPVRDKKWDLLTKWRVDALHDQLNAEATYKKLNSAEGLIKLNVIEPRVVDTVLAILVNGDGESDINTATDLLLRINIHDERVFNILYNRLDSIAPNADGSRTIGALTKNIVKLYPKDEKFLNKLIDKYEEATALTPSDSEKSYVSRFKGDTIRALGDFQVVNDRVINILLHAMTTTVESSPVDSLRRLNVNHPRVIDAILDRVNNPKDKHALTSDVIKALIEFGILNGDIRDRLVDGCSASTNTPANVPPQHPCSLDDISYILALNPKDERGISALLVYFKERKITFFDPFKSEVFACRVVSKFKVKDQRIIDSLLKLLSMSDDFDFNIEAVDTLQTLEVPDDRIADALKARGLKDDTRLIIGPALSKLHIKDNPALAALPIFLEAAEAPYDRSFGELGGKIFAEACARLVLFNPSETFESQLERLWKELGSDAAERSFGYRRCVQYALALLAEQQLENGAQNYDKVEAIRSRAQVWMKAAQPHHRIAAYEIIYLIDGMIERIKNPEPTGPY